MLKDTSHRLMTRFFNLSNGEIRIIKDIDTAVEFINDSLIIPLLMNICDYPGNHLLKKAWREEEYIWFELANHTLNSIKFKSLIIYYHHLSGMRGFIFSASTNVMPENGIILKNHNLMKQQYIRLNTKIYKSEEEISYIKGLISMGKIKEEFLFVNSFLSEGFVVCFSTNFKEKISDNISKLFKTIEKETDILNIYNI